MRSFSLLLLLLLPLLGGCRYNFVPLIPKTTGALLSLPVRISEASLVREGDMLLLRAKLDGKFEAGYLKATWFNDSKKLAEDSVYVDTAQPTATFKLAAPDKGAYRANLSFGGNVLRQVELYEVKP